MVACATAGLPSVRLRTGSSTGTSVDLPTDTNTVLSPRIEPVQFGPCSGAVAAAAPAALAGAGAMLMVICSGWRLVGSGAVALALAGAPSSGAPATAACPSNSPALSHATHAAR